MALSNNRTLNYLPYAHARAFVREHNIVTRKQYWAWHDEHKPKFLPKRPDKVWDNFSWNDFLGNTNSFEKTNERKKGLKKTYRTFWEAVRYAQKVAKEFNLTSKPQWEAFYDEYEVPEDIPKRPHQVYDEFNQEGIGWRTWLGKDMNERIAASRAEIGIVALHHVDEEPANVVVVKVYDGGYSEYNAVEDKPGKAYRLYKLENELMPQVDKIMKTFATGGSYGYTVPDMNQLLWELDNILLIYAP